MRHPMQLTLFTPNRDAETPIGTEVKKIVSPKIPVRLYTTEKRKRKTPTDITDCLTFPIFETAMNDMRIVAKRAIRADTREMMATSKYVGV